MKEDRAVFCYNVFMTWAGKRKVLYSLLLLGVALLIIIPVAYTLYPKPSCFDGRQNQDEQGIDCGGSCAKVCVEKTTPPRVLWARSFEVGAGVYSVAAYVSNPNISLGSSNVPYTFKIYDEKNILITKRSGVATILPNVDFPIFEGIIETGNRIPARVFFAFTATPLWQQLSEQVRLSSGNTVLLNEDGKPRLSTVITNPGIAAVKNVSVIAILYDSNGTAIAASQTIIDEIPKGDSQTAVFTWPAPFGKPVSRIEVSPEFLTSK